MKKWRIVFDNGEFILEAKRYQVDDNGVGYFYDEGGMLKHSVPADKAFVIQIDEEETKEP